jgi:transposase InsO family protein
VRYSFIQEHRKQFRLVTLCRVLRVSKSGYFAWRKRPESARAKANRALLGQIKAIHARSQKLYGRRKIHPSLRREGVVCSLNRVGRLMRLHGLCGLRRGKFKATTDSRHSFPVAPNLLARNFCAAAPDQVWVSDITYLACAEGWEYLATVMDLSSRRIVGWAIQSSLDRSLTLKALKMALSQRRPAPGLVHHSDRGVQYACGDYQALLKQHGAIPSMSRKGDCWDNAPKESFFGTLKCELGLQKMRLPREEAHRKVFEYIEIFYNRQRLHSSLGYLSPVEFELQTAAKAA